MCCGKKRAQSRRTTQSQRVSKPRNKERIASKSLQESDSPAYFQYVGKESLTVTVRGPGTENRYRFNKPGAVVAVDPRDRRAMATVSTLKNVR